MNSARARSAVPTPRHILVVDDEPLAASALSVYLERKGFRVSTAGSASEALRLYETDPADLVITDLLMPGGDGDALIDGLERAGAHVPVIVTTGQVDALPPRIGKSQLVLRKPLDLRQVLAEVERLLVPPA